MSLADALARIAESDRAIWIDRPDPDAVRAAAATGDRGRVGPLSGWTFAVKDNIDVAGAPTTAAIPARRSVVAATSAEVVERALAAGALYVGKNNLDQVATGLVGTRSPFGTPTNPLDPTRIPGGSSSGSAVAVAAGLVDLGLATDTAGSGRVPAACCGVVGLKPRPGALPLDGVLPASPSFDCVSLFTRTVAEALVAADALGAGFPRQPTARRLAIGVPDAGSRPFLTAAGQRALDADVEALRGEGHDLVPVDLTDHFAAGDLLYGSAWLAERTAAVGPLLDAAGSGAVDVVRTIVDGGRRHTAVEAFAAIARLGELRAATAALWDRVSVLLVPSVPHVPTLDEVDADPIAENVRLGRYTTFANLLGLAAITVPRGRRDDGTPASATVLGPAGSESAIGRVAVDLERTVAGPVGAIAYNAAWPEPERSSPTVP